MLLLTRTIVRVFSALHRKGHSVILTVQAKPNSRSNSILEVNDDHIKIAVKAPPIDGEANSVLIDFIAEVMEIDEGDVEIKKGNSSRLKYIALHHLNKTDD